MKRPQLVAKGTILRMRQAAEQAWHNRDLQQCIEILERASRLDHANIEVLLQLGRMQGICYNYGAAEQSFDKAIRVASNKTQVMAWAGQQARDFYNTNLALHYLQQAVAQKDVTPENLITLAEVYERLRRVDEATSLVDRALQQNPSCSPALLVRGRLGHRAGRLEDAESILRSFVDKAEKEYRVKGYYELGAILDRQGRYDEAMSAFLNAKALLRSDATPHIDYLKRVRAYLENMRKNLDHETIRRWSDFASELQPTLRLAFLCGHPRSGTTLLEQVLDSHPEITSAEETTHFNDYAYRPLQQRKPIGTPLLDVLESAPKEILLSSRTAYIRASELCLGKRLENRLLIDKNPSLTLTIPSIIRILPEAKFLIALRDPRDVVLSCFMQPFFPIHDVSSAYLSLESAVEEYLALMSVWQTVKLLLKNPFLEVRYEDMVEDLESVARKSLDFLGVPWDDRVLGFDEHARMKTVRSPTYADVTQKVFKRARGRWRHYEKYLSPHLEKLSTFVQAFGYDRD